MTTTTRTSTPTSAPATLDRTVVAALLLALVAMPIAAIGSNADPADLVQVRSYLEVSNDPMPTGLTFMPDRSDPID